VSDIQPRPFDERAALAELERLADKIQSSRRQREKAVEEFESFVKTFRNDRYVELISQHESGLQSELQSQAMPAVRTAEPPPVERRSVAAALPGPPTEPAPRPLPVPAFERSVKRPLSDPAYVRPALAAAATVLLIALVFWLFRGSSDAPASDTPAPATPTAQAPVASPPPTPVASTGPSRAINIELTTIRPVWMRVTVDGERVIESEVPAGRQIPLQADKLIQIRAGDGGAVRLTVGGQDQGALGRDGQIANRTLTPPKPR
jgi:Domain of unknown function (DUF4115)